MGNWAHTKHYLCFNIKYRPVIFIWVHTATANGYSYGTTFK